MSTLSNLHVIAGDFNAALFDFLTGVEGWVPRIYRDGKGIPTLGVGFALNEKGDRLLFWRSAGSPARA